MADPGMLSSVGAEFVSGADVILGALLGGLSAGLSNILIEWRRSKREDKTRDHAERRDVYAEFSRLCTEVVSDKKGDPQPVRDLFEKWRVIALVTRTQEVADLAEKIATELSDAFALRGPVSSATALSVPHEYESNMRKFLAAARKDLGKPLPQ